MLFTPDVVHEKWDKAIYLDSDLLVESSLSHLWNKSFDEAAVLAVQDYVAPFVSMGLGNYDDLGFSPETPYFNTGVLVLNLQRWRREGIRNNAFTNLREYKNYVTCADQDCLNMTLADDWQPLDLRWNVTLDSDGFFQWAPESSVKKELRSRFEELFYNPHIHHFADPHKPWELDHPHPAQFRWYRYLWKSGWLSLGERIKSMARYYINVIPRNILVYSRPLRHQITRRISTSISKLTEQ